MPIVNGELVDKLVTEILLKNPRMDIGGISEDLGGGVQPHGFAAKQLLDARKGESVGVGKLERIALRLSDLLEREINYLDFVACDLVDGSVERLQSEPESTKGNHQTAHNEGNDSDVIVGGANSQINVTRKIVQKD